MENFFYCEKLLCHDSKTEKQIIKKKSTGNYKQTLSKYICTKNAFNKIDK